MNADLELPVFFIGQIKGTFFFNTVKVLAVKNLNPQSTSHREKRPISMFNKMLMV